jgi:hypothetical protein
MSAANLSAVTIPLIRMVFWMSPVVIVAVRRAALSAFAAPVPARCFRIHANPPAATRIITIPTHKPVLRGFGGSGRKSSGDAGGFAGAADGGTLLGMEALLI